MKEKTETKKMKIERWIISPFLVVIVLLVNYFIKGIYTFGSRNIAYYDLGQCILPIYYHTYDVLHGDQSLFWNWYSGGGVSMIDTVGNFVIFPTNLFFLFVSREKILESMSFFLLLKIGLSSFSMEYFAKKRFFGMSKGWQIICGVIYASSGYILQYYTNMQFLDVVAIFPLIIYGLDLLLDEQKHFVYCIFMALVFITNVQFMAMVCYFVVIYSAVHLWGKQKEIQKKAILNLGVGTLLSLLVTAVVWLPTVIAILNSSRAEGSGALLVNIINDLSNQYFMAEKMFMLFGCEFIVALLIILTIKDKNKLKEIKRELIIVGFLLVPIFVEMVNSMWHVGGYVSFPMRFGFMLPFASLLVLGKISAYDKIYNTKIKNNSIRIIIGIFIVALLVGIEYCFASNFLDLGILAPEYFQQYWLVLVTSVFLYCIVIYLNYNSPILKIMILVQCFIGWSGFLAPTLSSQMESGATFVEISEALSSDIQNMVEDVDPRIARVKDDTVAMNVNYPFIVQNGSISNWTWGSSGDLLYLKRKWGYSQSYVRLLDTGGTLFTDAILGVQKVVSLDSNENEVYQNVGQKGIFYLKENNIVYPFGIMVSENMVNWSYGGMNEFEYQNQLFKQMNLVSEDLFKLVDVAECVDKLETVENEGKIVLNIPIEKKEVLYLKVPNVNGNQYSFAVNGDFKRIPALSDYNSAIYPNQLNNGIVDCGLFEKGDVQLIIYSDYSFDISQILIACMDVSVLDEQIQKQEDYERDIQVDQNSISYYVDNIDQDGVLLPIGYTQGLSATRNGEKIEIEKTLENALIYIPLVDGINEIRIEYIPQGLQVGVVISILGIVVFALFSYRKEYLYKMEIMMNMTRYCFWLVFWGLVLVLYILPVILNILLYGLYISGNLNDFLANENLEKLGITRM